MPQQVAALPVPTHHHQVQQPKQASPTEELLIPPPPPPPPPATSATTTSASMNSSDANCQEPPDDPNRNSMPNCSAPGADKTTLSSSTNQHLNGENSSSSANETSATTVAATKLNGLKNRIIQRPPPLILDKVSYFYDNETQSSIVNNNNNNNGNGNAIQQQKPSQTTTQTNLINQNKSNYPNGNTLSSSNSIINSSKNNYTSSSITNAKINTATTTNSNSANHKFWASLNQNASRARSTSGLLLGQQNHHHSHPHQQQHAINPIHMSIARTNTAPNSLRQAPTIESNSSNNLGPDLIISHRSGNTNTRMSILSQAVDELQTKNSAFKAQNQCVSNSIHKNDIKLLTPETKVSTKDCEAALKTDNPINDNGIPIESGAVNLSRSSNQDHSMSNNSELDDSAHACATSENGGGNLIGVDNPTPPASAINHQLNEVPIQLVDEPPASATSSRPRSNNPFLATDDELMSAFSQTHSDQQQRHLNNGNSFHHRPASFMAATDNTHKPMIQQRHHLTQQLYNDPQQQHKQQLQLQQQQVNDQLYNLRIDDNNQHLIDLPSSHRDDIYGSLRGPIVNTNESRPNHDQRDGSYSAYQQMNFTNQEMQPQNITAQLQNYYSGIVQPPQQHQSIYGTYGHLDRNHIIYEPIISVDSESTVRKPPPMPTMQLSHWTDAIYELNNAILEKSSVAGGTENAQFIHIIESGDIILELDQVKVSGFTLVEFNELLESKQTHLLKAVQTKHSHGLTTDLKHYLNCSFSTNSADKDLQDLIRENIYRRTIPCTTRPPREGELDKIDYHFLTREQFIELNNRGMLLECGMYGGHYYGTMKPLTDMSCISIYGTNGNEISNEMCQTLTANHPAVHIPDKKFNATSMDPDMFAKSDPNMLYENYESMKMHQIQAYNVVQNSPQIQERAMSQNQRPLPIIEPQTSIPPPMGDRSSSIVAIDSESLPHGWERVIDQTHGTYYIDHNTQRTQYEMPYEVELIKGPMGFGFTLVEADSGVLLVRSVITGGPAYQNGLIRPGDILVSAVGVSVSGMQHTDIARLFSTFAIGERVRLTFARSSYVVDMNMVPDEYLYSNGTIGDNTGNEFAVLDQTRPSFTDQDEWELHQVDLDRDSRDSNWGIRLIGGAEVDRAITIGSIVLGGAASKNGCLRSGDEIISINGYNVVGATHKYVVNLISACANRASLLVRRKKFAEACDVVLTRSMDEGFGFVIISRDNCAQICRIIEGSPAERCQQLHVRDRIIAINGNYITPNMRHPDIVNMIKECGSTLRLRIIPEDCYTVELIKNSSQDNFGFSMRGGHNGMLHILRVAPNGLARDLLNVGDQIIEINGVSTVGMSHQQAAGIIKFSDPIVKLKLRRNYMQVVESSRQVAAFPVPTNYN